MAAEPRPVVKARLEDASGVDISAANPLPVDVSPGNKVATKVLDVANLAAGGITLLAACAVIDLKHGPDTLALTVEATYNAAATRGIRVHVVSSYDNTNYDTQDWDTWNPDFIAGASIRQTKNYATDPYGIKARIENLDAAQAVTNLKIYATVGA